MMPMISLAELQRRIESGDLSTDAAVSQSCEAIDAQDKTIGAFVCRAKTLRAASAGPLRGIAVGIKDIIDTSDLPTEMGSPIYRDWQPRADAPVAADRRREMFFVDTRHGRAVRGRRQGSCPRAFSHDGPARIAAGCSDAGAAHRCRDAGVCRRTGGSRRGGAADRG